MKMTMHVSSKEAGHGAFCTRCQSEENKLTRFMHTLRCRKAKVTNQNGDHNIFLCDECIIGSKDEAERTGAYNFVIDAEEVTNAI